MNRITAALQSLAIATWPLCTTPAAADDMDWWPEPDVVDVSGVNDGELRFLDPPPSDPVHLNRTRLFIEPDSLTEGWTRMEQCHFDLDPVPRTAIAYTPGRARDIKVVTHAGIEQVWIEGDNVELKGIGRGASLCVQLYSRTLEVDGDAWRLRNGPFMRRFFDGYYPLHVWLQVEYDDSGLELVNVDPPAQPGLRVTREPGTLTLDAWFEGRLFTTVRLRSKPATP